MKNKYFRFSFIFLLVSAILALVYLVLLTPPIQVSSGHYSVILYQYTDNDWTALLEGIRQAEEDSDAVVNYVTMPSGGTPENELELIKREIENGADGLLLAPVDSETLAEEIEQLEQPLPILTLETGLGSEDADISADNYQMGYLLGTRVAQDMKKTASTAVCVITEYIQRQSVQRRFQGFTDAIYKNIPDATITEYTRSVGDYSLPVCIANMYGRGYAGTYIVALDKYCTEALIDASDNPQIAREFEDIFRQRAFGIGNTQKTVSGLDAGKIRGLVYQNEFNIGYQGLQALIQQSQNRELIPTAEIKYYYVTRDTLYDPEHQRLLFPLK